MRIADGEVAIYGTDDFRASRLWVDDVRLLFLCFRF